MVLATCWNIPMFFETKTCYLTKQSMDAKLLSEDIRKKRDNEEILYPQVCFTDLGGYTYRRDYILFANFVIMGLIPFLLLFILSGITFRKIKLFSLRNSRISLRQQRDHDIARMLILVVIVFLFCNTPRIILNTWEVRLLKLSC